MDKELLVPWIIDDDHFYSPWTDAIAIVTDDNERSIVCWMTRGWDNMEGAKHICDLHNQWVDRLHSQK